MKIGDLEYPSLQGEVSEAEWGTRVDLAALYRLLAQSGWFDLAGPPAAAKVPGEAHYLINPMGFLFEEITASSLVKVTLDGQKVGDSPFQFSRPVWYLMQGIFSARPDVAWAIHTHDEFGAALSMRPEGLRGASQSGGFAVAAGLAYHDYDGVETYAERMESLQASLGASNFMILRNHGLLALGQSAYQAFYRIGQLSKACRIELLAGRDQDLVGLPTTILESFAEELRRGPAVDNYWPGLLRRLDRADPSYRL